MKQVSGSLLSTVALFLLLPAPLSLARTYEFEESVGFEVEEGLRLSIENQVGSISLAPSSDGRLNILIIKEIDAISGEEAEEIREEIDVEIDATPTEVVVKTYYPDYRSGRGFWKQVFGIGNDRSGKVHYEIKVPTSVKLFVTATSADIWVRGLTGEFQFDLTSGDMKLTDLTGFCEIEATSGDVEARDINGDISVSVTSSDTRFSSIEGNLDLEATSGDTEIRWVSGRVRVDKSSGDTRIDKTSGDLEVNSTSGDISILQRSGEFWVKTSSGDVYIESEMVDGDVYDVSSISGDITLRFPVETDADIRVATVSGEIDAEAELEVRSLGKREIEGKIGRGGKLLRLNSSSGDISLATY